MSPEDMEQLHLGALDNQANTESEIFAIGLLLLATSTQHTHQDLYKLREK